LKAVLHREHGGLDKLELAEVPTPTPKAGEVLVRVRAAGLNHLDLWTLNGIAGVKIPLPHIAGSDIAGEIAALGEGVKGWVAGDRVVVNPSLWCGHCEYCRRGDINYCPEFQIIGEHVDGGLAEFIALPVRHLLRVPAHVSLETAAAAALVYQTAWRMVVVRGALHPGEWVLVNGAGGGVATAAIQIAKLSGAHVVATTSTAEKMESARGIGADVVLNYKTQEVDKEVYKLTGKRGVDLVVDNIGEAAWKQNLRALARGGRLVLCGATTGNNPPTQINVIYWKQLSVLGSTMGNLRDFEHVMGLVFAGRVKPVIDRVLPIVQYREAFERLAKGDQFGKIILTP
jgi:NADPH:quinone reductase-like Zn-dependent oxidoreductase